MQPGEFATAEAYRASRIDYRARCIAWRRLRTAALGPCMRLQFEDEATVRYQIHEALFIEGLTDEAAVRAEIAAYRHLVPAPGEWKASLLIEIPDAAERRRSLAALSDAAHSVYAAAAGLRVTAEANEDLADRHRGRPSAVHFLRFALAPSLRDAVRAGATLELGCMHPAYACSARVGGALREALQRELAPDSATPAPIRQEETA